jgi:aminoglycoside phosphotransferase (APT) family kinase protein
LLHLDLHPFNVLVDDTGAVTGVIDWANAAVGAPVLDRARSWSILTLDPGALSLQSNAGWVTLTDAWMAEGRLTSLPASARGRVIEAALT